MSLTVRFDPTQTRAAFTLAHPTGNIITAELVAAFRAALETAGDNPYLKLLTIEGAGADFSFGASVPEHTPDVIRQVLPEMHGLIEDLLECRAPTAAVVRGRCLGGGFELALACDFVFAAEDAVFGVFCRRFGVPLLDLGTLRLPRLLGHSHAMDLILTGRGVKGEEALRMGVANRLVPHGQALKAAVDLAHELARFPQRCLRSDRLSAYEQWSLSYEDGWRNELRRGRDVIKSGETAAGADSFARGKGRHGAF